ncbi:MAG: hypothetical protein HQM12_03030 [SAR324 cluster bacterium]|nr:hypothetical protein [SAR324 cluster bacterium]
MPKLEPPIGISDFKTIRENGLYYVESLLNGGTVSAPLDDNIVLRDIEQSHNTIWNFLTFSGYLKAVRSWNQGTHSVYELALPNLEVRHFYETSIKLWLSRQIGDQRLSPLLQALLKGDIKKVDPDDDSNPGDAMTSALKQIQDKQYASELRAHGIEPIIGIGIVVEGKRVWVESLRL